MYTWLLGIAQTFTGGHFRFGEGGRREEVVTCEDLSMEEFITREENFHEVDAGFHSIIKKNNEKINKKKFLFSWK